MYSSSLEISSFIIESNFLIRDFLEITNGSADFDEIDGILFSPSYYRIHTFIQAAVLIRCPMGQGQILTKREF